MDEPDKPLASAKSADQTPTAGPSSESFVQRDGSRLVVDGKTLRFASLNSPELLDGDCNQQFEVIDTMETLGNSTSPRAFGSIVGVTRTYTLRVSPNASDQSLFVVALTCIAFSNPRSNHKISDEVTSTVGTASGTTGNGTLTD